MRKLLVLQVMVLLAVSQLYSQSLSDSLVAWYPFSGNANDLSGNGNNGTVTGATLTTDRFGNANSAYSFDGVNDSISLTDMDFNSNFSICFWFYPQNISTECFLILKGAASDMDNYVLKIMNDSLICTIRGVGPVQKTVRNKISLNTWYFAVLKWDGNVVGSKLRLYINGGLVDSTDAQISIWNNNTITTLGIGGTRAFNGKMDDIRFYKRSLSSTEINALYGPSPFYGMNLINSAGNSFQMGQVGVGDAEPVHQVSFTYNFWMDSTEVTQADYLSLMGVNPSHFTGDLNRPVEEVTWFDVVLYCNKRSKRDGKDTVYSYTGITGVPGNGCTALANFSANFSKNGYRLPTESEWEFACRAGTTTDYYWGTNPIANYVWYVVNSNQQTHPVATKLPNSFGLYDMSGNVFEWCHDWYAPYTSGIQVDPIGAATGTVHVLKGGSWYHVATLQYSAIRGWPSTVVKDMDRGFRCALGQITIAPVNNPPGFIGMPDTNATEDVAWSYVVTAVDVDAGDVVTLSLPTKPTGMTLVGTTLSWTPVNSDVGVNNVTVRATDNHGAFSEQVFRVRVANVNDLPVAVNDAYTINEDNAVTVSTPGILSNDTDVDGPTLTAILVTNVAQGTLTLNANGSFVYTPPANFNGSTTFTYQATDGIGLSSIATVTLTVNAVNDVPVSVNDTFTIIEDAPLTVVAPGILSNDTDADAQALTAVLLANVAQGTLTLNANGSFVYTPSSNLAGTVTFTYRSYDGTALSNAATVIITITAVNDSPSISSVAPVVAVQNLPYSYQAQALDPDVGDVLTWTLTTAPTGMTVSSTGLVTWTPTPAQVGSNSVVLQVKDAANVTAQQSFTITVTNVNDAPVITDPVAQTATEDVPFTLNLSATDSDGNQIFWYLVQGPDSLKVNMSTGAVTWTPLQNKADSTVQVKIRATDAVMSDTTTFNITVTAVNDPPVITTVLPNTFIPDSLYTIPLTATDEEGGTITWSALKKPPTMSIVSSNLVWVPVRPGLDTIVLVASDGTKTDTLTAIVQVLDLNDAPVITDPAVQMATEDVPFSITLAATDADGNQIFWYVVQGPDSLKVNMNTGVVTWTPRQNKADSNVQVKIRATDAILSDTTTFNITVIAVNDPPVITAIIPNTFKQDSLYSMPLTATDEEGNAITWTAPKKPSTMNIVTNILVWMPIKAGLDTIVLVASDGTSTDTLTTIVQVIASVGTRPLSIRAVPSMLSLSSVSKQGRVSLMAGLPAGINTGTVKIFNISGRLVENHNISGSGWHTVNLQNHSMGVLLARISAGGKTVEKRIISR